MNKNIFIITKKNHSTIIISILKNVSEFKNQGIYNPIYAFGFVTN